MLVFISDAGQQVSEETPTSALTQFIVLNAVTLADQVASHAVSGTKRGKAKSKKSHGIVDKFLNEVLIARVL